MCPCKQTSLWLSLVLFGAHATSAVGYYNDVQDVEIQVDATGAVGAPNGEKGMSLIQSKMRMASSSASENHPHHHQHQKVDPPVSHLSQKEGKACKEVVKAPAGASYHFNPDIPPERMCCDGLTKGPSIWIQWGFKYKCDDHLSEPHQDEHAAKATVKDVCPKTCAALLEGGDKIPEKDTTEEEPEKDEDKVPEKVEKEKEEEPEQKDMTEREAEEKEEKDMTEEEAEIAGEDKVGEGDDNCKKSPWGKWGACTKTCASKPGEEAGKKVRHRNVEPFNCARSFEEVACANDPCPVDCIMSEWEEWGACPAGCKNEGVKQNRTRTIKQKPAHGGQCCPETKECENKNEPECGPALLVEDKPCGEEKQKCEPSPWSEWSPCSQTCNTGKKTRARSIETPAKCGGAPCLCDFLEVKNCEHGSCVQQCELSTWSEWSKCPVTCGGSMQTRERKVLKAPAGGAPDCPPLIESKNCGMACCKRDCVVSSWDTWSFCSASCYGTQKRTRKVEVTPCGTGQKCDALFESRECNHDCVLPCEVGEWGPWGSCSATCGGGTKMRSREITQQEANGGKNCPPLWETSCCEETNFGCSADESTGEEPEVAIQPTYTPPKVETATFEPEVAVQPTHPPEAHAQWLLSGKGNTCDDACPTIGLICQPADFHAHLKEVDTDKEMGEVLSSIGGAECSKYNTLVLDGAAMPNINVDTGECYMTSSTRSADSIDCAEVPGPDQDQKKRLCWCSDQTGGHVTPELRSL